MKSDYYAQMMHYLYAGGYERGFFTVEMSNQEIDRRRARLKEELDFIENHSFKDFPFYNKQLVKIYPETLKRCEVSIHESSYR